MPFHSSCSLVDVHAFRINLVDIINLHNIKYENRKKARQYAQFEAQL